MRVSLLPFWYSPNQLKNDSSFKGHFEAADMNQVLLSICHSDARVLTTVCNLRALFDVCVSRSMQVFGHAAEVDLSGRKLAQVLGAFRLIHLSNSVAFEAASAASQR